MKISSRILVLFFVVSLVLVFMFFHGGGIYSVKSTIFSSESLVSVRNEVDQELIHQFPLLHGDTVEEIHVFHEADSVRESKPDIDIHPDVQRVEVIKDTTPKVAKETNPGIKDIDYEVMNDGEPEVVEEESDHEVVNKNTPKADKEPDVSLMSQAELEKFQQSQVDKYCKRYHFEDRKLKLPENRGHPIFRHLLPNDKAKTVLCYAAKVGCTSLKTLYYTTQGLIPKPKDFFKNNDKLQWVVGKYSLLSKNNSECLKDLTTYYKFVMFRHPLDRLLSAYRDKVRLYPMHTLADDPVYYNWYRKNVYQYTHPVEFKKWVANKGKVPINITFTDFITYWLETKDPRAMYDEHFIPLSDQCDPCRTRFNFYGDFDNFDRDVSVLVEKIGGSMEKLHPGYYKDNKQTTHNLVKEHFSLLTPEQKRGVLKRLSPELDFYYSIFPNKRDNHKEILDMSEDLIIPEGVEPY